MNRKLIFISLIVLILVSVTYLPLSAQTDDTEAQIEALVENMESAVLADDVELYLSYVDLSDPVFAREHTNWANEWADEDFLTGFDLQIGNIDVVDTLAIGLLELSWQTSLPEQPGQTARYWVQFVFDEVGATWFYGGEYWITTETDNFVVHNAPGMDDSAESLIPVLPDVYETVTEEFEYLPQNPMEIKIYDSQQALGATTLLSLPLIAGWNEPGESLKIIGFAPDAMPAIVAHEFTHFLTFDQANTSTGFMPWWLNEGIAEYFSRTFVLGYDPDVIDETVVAIRGLSESGGLVAWEDISIFEETPVDLWGYVYPQGYVFVYFMTEMFGREARNDWLHLMAEMSIEDATDEVFDKSFDDLNQLFLLWLADYPPD